MDNTRLLNAVIIDDEKRGISTLKQLVQKYIPDVQIIAECMKPADAVKLIEDQKPDILFLDIDMPGMNGFEMLDKLSWRNFNLVFTTAHQEYGLRALKNNAIDYLLKPISYTDLIQTVTRIRQKLSNDTVHLRFNYSELLDSVNNLSKSRLLINSVAGMDYIDPEDIICLISQSNYTKIILKGSKEVVTRKTLKEFESQLCLPDSDFMRVHNSYIINVRKAARYLKATEEIILDDGTKVPLSKTRRDLFFRWLNL